MLHALEPYEDLNNYGGHEDQRIEKHMDEKTPRQRLKESLKENAEHVEKQWTAETRSAISTVRVFDVAPSGRRADVKKR